MIDVYKRRRLVLIIVVFVVSLAVFIGGQYRSSSSELRLKPQTASSESISGSNDKLALTALSKLNVAADDYRSEYLRSYFGNSWGEINGCSTREVILYRDLDNVNMKSVCEVMSGDLLDPYSGKQIHFARGKLTSSSVQIDHVVALSDAWKKGAQNMTNDERHAFANDPLELLAVSQKENETKSGYDASNWLPSNVAYRCTYIARQVAVKLKYALWLSSAENATMSLILKTCPDQTMPQK